MIKSADHVTVAVKDLDAAIEFFGKLGFYEEHRVVISGEPFESYMRIPDLKADHITLVLKDCNPRFEIQVLRFHNPTPQHDPHINRLDKLGYNHLCFAVDNITEEVARLKQCGVTFINKIMDFNNKKLVYLEGPEGIIIELGEYE